MKVPKSRALFIFPVKALARDQLKSLANLASEVKKGSHCFWGRFDLVDKWTATGLVIPQRRGRGEDCIGKAFTTWAITGACYHQGSSLLPPPSHAHWILAHQLW